MGVIGERGKSDDRFMTEALRCARAAESAGEVPVGAVLVIDDEIVASGSNSPISSHDPSAHAEMNALREAAAIRRNYRLPGATLYVTLEPCPMCMGAIYLARIARLVFGARDPKTGAAGGLIDLRDAGLPHELVVHGGVRENECAGLLREFFLARR